MKIRKNPKKNRTRHAIPVVILSTVLLFTMSVFYIDSTSSSAAGTDHLFLPDSTVTNTASDDSTNEGSDNSTDEDGTTEYLVTTEYPDEPGKAPELASNYAIVLDANTGNILYQKNAFDKQYPASITKIMTFLLAIENTKLTDTVTMSHDAVFGIDRGSSHIGLDEGEQISMEDALYGMMLESANEVAWGIGEFVSGGSIEDFAKMMNELISFFVGTDRFKQGDFAGVFSGVTEHHEQLVVDTPGSVCDQTVAFGMVVGIDRLDKTDGSDREQIIIVGGSNVFFCNMGDQTHIGFNQNPACIGIPCPA